jgi:hypothetical protein
VSFLRAVQLVPQLLLCRCVQHFLLICLLIFPFSRPAGSAGCTRQAQQQRCHVSIIIPKVLILTNHKCTACTAAFRALLLISAVLKP